MATMEETTHYNIVTTPWGGMRILTDKGLEEFVNQLNNYHYDKWNPEIVQLRTAHPDINFKDGMNSNSLSFQARAFITDRAWKDYGFNRAQLVAIMDKLCPDKKSGDVIQLFNKIDQHGINRFSHRLNRVTYYSCPVIEYSGKNHRARPSGEEGLYGEAGNREWWKALSKEEFQSGHKDPSKPLTTDNTVMQPATLNRTYRDTYVFDDRGLPVFPTIEEFLTNTSKYVSSKFHMETMATHILKLLPPSSQKQIFNELFNPPTENIVE